MALFSELVYDFWKNNTFVVQENSGLETPQVKSPYQICNQCVSLQYTKNCINLPVIINASNRRDKISCSIDSEVRKNTFEKWWVIMMKVAWFHYQMFRLKEISFSPSQLFFRSEFMNDFEAILREYRYPTKKLKYFSVSIFFF